MNIIKIYHNPNCSKSRKTLEIIENAGFKPEVIIYLESPPTVSEIKAILTLLNLKPRELMRKGESEYKDNHMYKTSLSDDQLIKLMFEFPKVIERPIVLSNGKAVISRPPESVLGII